MFEKIFGKKKSIQRSLIVEFIITIILVTFLSIIGFYIFIHQEIVQIIQINVENYDELKELLTIIRRGVLIMLINAIVVSAVIIKISSKKMLEPLEKMIKATKQVAAGDFEIRLETKRKDEIKELVTNFNHMTEELGQTELLQKDFINNVSHEIKTPINSIQGFTKLLDDDSLKEEERKEYIEIILEELDRLLNLSSNILKLAKLQNQNRITKIEQVNIAEQLRKTIALLEPKWKGKNLEFEVDLEDSYFYGDEDLLFQVWTNLIDNSIKFSKQNGKIEVTTKQDNSKIIVKIQDNGIGIEKQELDKIFKRFYQIDKSHSGDGSGLRIINC